MARLPRLYAPATVQYVAQQAAPGRDLFGDAGDYAVFLQALTDAAAAHQLAVHAYALLPRRVLLLATPSHPESMPRAMQAIGRRYVPYANRKAARTGTLWERRYRSTLIEAADYLLPAMRHVERSAVESGLVTLPEDWRWSSHAHHIGTSQQPFLSDHAIYWGLSDAPFERQAAYRLLAGEPLPKVLATRIDDAVAHGWVLGSPEALNRRGSPLPRGRPRSVPV